MTCTNAYDTIVQADGVILPNYVISDINDIVSLTGGNVTSSCRVADGTYVAWFKNDEGNSVGDGTSKAVWPSNIASSVQIFVGYFADDGSPAVVHDLSVQSVFYVWTGTGVYSDAAPCSSLPILGMRYSDVVKSELHGWLTAIKDVRVCTDGVNVWVAVLAQESVDYPFLYGLGGNDRCGNFHPSLAGYLAAEAGDAFNHDTSSAGYRFWCHFGSPGEDDRGPHNSFRWQPSRVSVWCGDLGGFTFLDTVEAAFSNDSNWGMVSGVEACASPAEPGVLHVLWSEGGPFGNQFIAGESYGQRINYSQWDAGGKTLDTDLTRSEGDRGLGSGPADPYDWVWTAEMILRNDHGSPIALVWPWTGTRTYPGFGSEPGFDGPDSIGPAQFWDLSSGSINLVQTMDADLLPTTVEFGGLSSVLEQGAFLANIADSIWSPAPPPIVPRRVHYASSLYTDPLLADQDVYLICCHFYDPEAFLTMPGGDIVPTEHTAFYRIPVDGSQPFDFLDGTRLVGFSIVDWISGLMSDFVSDPDNVWMPGGNLGYVSQLDRQCLHGWRDWPAFPTAISFGVHDIGSGFAPINTVSPPAILTHDGTDWLAGGGYQYEVPITADSEVDVGAVQAKICRCCEPCNRTGMHVWEII